MLTVQVESSGKKKKIYFSYSGSSVKGASGDGVLRDYPKQSSGADCHEYPW